MLGDPDTLRGVRDRFLSYKSGSLLEHVAEETGGLAIRNTNDLAGGLVARHRRAARVLRGRLHAAQPRPRRPVPPHPGEGHPPRRPGADARRLLRNPRDDADRGRLRADPDRRARPGRPAAEPSRTRCGWCRTVRKTAIARSSCWPRSRSTRSRSRATRRGGPTPRTSRSWLSSRTRRGGPPVVRLSQDWPVERKLDEAARVPQAKLVFRRVMSLPPGRYTVESAIQDRRPGASAWPGRRSTSRPRRATACGEAVALRSSVSR